MWLMARELQGTHVGLLVPCPSSAANKNKVRPVWQYFWGWVGGGRRCVCVGGGGGGGISIV